MPVEMVVVNECPIHQDAAVWYQSSRDDIGGIGGCAAILRRARATLRISFHHEPCEVRDALVNLIDLVFPPLSHAAVQRIKSLKATHCGRAAQINRQCKLHSP